jgi:hypothetical protein
MTNASRGTVNSHLKRFEAEGLLERDYGHIRTVEAARLRAEAMRTKSAEGGAVEAGAADEAVAVERRMDRTSRRHADVPGQTPHEQLAYLAGAPMRLVRFARPQ